MLTSCKTYPLSNCQTCVWPNTSWLWPRPAGRSREPSQSQWLPQVVLLAPGRRPVRIQICLALQTFALFTVLQYLNLIRSFLRELPKVSVLLECLKTEIWAGREGDLGSGRSQRNWVRERRIGRTSSGRWYSREELWLGWEKGQRGDHQARSVQHFGLA